MADELELLRDLGRELAEPDEASVTRARTVLQQRIDSSGAGRKHLWRPLYLRWAVAGAAAVLLAGGFGFGLGSWSTGEGRATSSVVGLGFLPAKGWTVVQSEGRGPTVAAATAANVALHRDDAPGGLPRATLADLPRNGVVVVGTFTLRGDPHADALFPVRPLPLRFANASQVTGFEDPLVSSRRLTRYRLRAGVGAYNLDAWIYLGSARGRGTIDATQRQLNRLLVTSERITMATRDRVVPRNQPFVTLFGSVESGKADEPVTVEGKECGRHAPFFRQWVAARTRPGGGWSTEAYVRTTTTFRANWADATSAAVTVQARAAVVLQPTGSARQFEVRAGGLANFWRKRVDIQRFNRRVGTWIKLRSVVLTDNTYGGSASATFTLRVPKRTLLRAFFPLSQARPCYLAGYSNLIHA